MTNSIYDSKINYPKGTPFTYLIGWTELDIHYYGVKFAKDCHPSDLWTNYFTSSKVVKQFRIENGEPDIIKVDYVFDNGDEAREYEEEFLKTNNCVRDSKWLNQNNGGKDFCVTEERKPHTEEHKQKISEALKGKPRKPRKPFTEECRKKISDAKKGKTHTEEHKQKISDARRGKPRSSESIKKYQETCQLKRLTNLQSVSDLF